MNLKAGLLRCLHVAVHDIHKKVFSIDEVFSALECIEICSLDVLDGFRIVRIGHKFLVHDK